MKHKNIIDLIQKISCRHSTWNVFSDFLEMAACAISNSIDKQHYQGREKRYLDIVKNYNKSEIECFGNLLPELILEMEKDLPYDILGEVYEQLGLANKWNGQFFTPNSVSRLMASINLNGVENNKLFKQKGYISLNEPACGGGALILATAAEMINLKLNPQRQLFVIAQDIDIKSVFMAYIQLSLFGVPTVIYHANTLTLDVYDVWYTPMYFIGGWQTKAKDLLKTTA